VTAGPFLLAFVYRLAVNRPPETYRNNWRPSQHGEAGLFMPCSEYSVARGSQLHEIQVVR